MTKQGTLSVGYLLSLFFFTLAAPQPLLAKVSSEEAAALGSELTPFGAIQAGKADATIPPWEGGLTKPPDQYRPGMHHPDPFPDDPILFTITPENLSEYEEYLSPGQISMFRRYPESWFMNIYPSRRTAAYPQFVYDAVMANATRASLISDGNGVLACGVGSPFPIPQSGVEAIWNHRLRYTNHSVVHSPRQAAPTPGGSYTMVKFEEKLLLPYQVQGTMIEDLNNIGAYLLQTIVAPARLAGRILLVHETIDSVKEPRRAWVYNPGQRRVRRAPHIGYDNPGSASDGQRTSDQYDMFASPPDRYDWELLGRREMYIPYNAYGVYSDALSYNDILRPGHVNPEHLRYELHRVWAVEATLKEGVRHIYARRTFYLDEDSWGIVAVDQYDGRGEIWRVSEAHSINAYEVPTVLTILCTHYDLQNGRYLAYGLYNETEAPRIGVVRLSEDDFAPGILRQLGRR